MPSKLLKEKCSSGHTDTKNRLVDTVGEGEGRTN